MQQPGTTWYNYNSIEKDCKHLYISNEKRQQITKYIWKREGKEKLTI